VYIDTEESFPGNLIDHDFAHVVHSGSLLSITEPTPFLDKAIDYVRKARDKGVSQMGICYGHQLVCRALVGKHAVRPSPKGLEAGWTNITFLNDAMHVLGVRGSERVWQHHFDEVTELPEGSELLATNQHSRIQAFINYEQRLFGTQFHPEFDRETGNRIFLEDRELLADNNYNADDLIKRGPSFDAGNVFFGLFLRDWTGDLPPSGRFG
jgi:GMP synthase (glutamine-hydrolysing)